MYSKSDIVSDTLEESESHIFVQYASNLGVPGGMDYKKTVKVRDGSTLKTPNCLDSYSDHHDSACILEMN